MPNNILFIFEGERTEKIIVQSLEKHILLHNAAIKCAYAADIYQLYREIESDSDLDVFNLLKERNITNKELLKDFSRNDFAEIYLFFDYDAHSSLASEQDQYGNQIKPGDEKLYEMLSLFDNETNKGKLYLSYPMVEAVRHIVDFNTFSELLVKCKRDNCCYMNTCLEKDSCKQEPHYKKIVADSSIPQLCNITGYTKETWKKLTIAHLCKMNYLIFNAYEYPQKTESQLSIFSHQLEKHINKQCPKISVLSAFPIFIHDFYGNNKTRELIYS